MEKTKREVPNDGDMKLEQWAQVTALAIELLAAGVRREEPGLSTERVMERSIERLRRDREAKFGERRVFRKPRSGRRVRRS